MNSTPEPQSTVRESVIYDAICSFQRTHRLPGLQHAQIRDLLAEHLARTLPSAAVSVAVPPTVERRDRYAQALHRCGVQLDDAGSLADLDDIEQVAVLAAAVLAVADAEQAELRQEVRRLGLMVDEYGQGASALTDKLKRVRDLHRETCIAAQSLVPPTAFRCGMCHVLDAPASVPPQPETQAGHEAHPPYTSWLVEVRMDEGHWAVAYPTHDHEKALDRMAKRRAQQPDRTWRLVRETDTYTVEAEQPESETHVVADGSDDPEHVDDCPGCAAFSLTGHVATAPAVVSQPDEEA